MCVPLGTILHKDATQAVRTTPNIMLTPLNTRLQAEMLGGAKSLNTQIWVTWFCLQHCPPSKHL